MALEVPHPRLTRRHAGDASARASRHVVPRGFHVLFTDSCWRGSDSGRFARNRANSGLNRLYRPKRTIQAEIQIKKKVQYTPFDLYLNPTSTQFHTNAKT